MEGNKVVKDKEKFPKECVLLIFLCWLVYMCSYLGKVNYSAVKVQVMQYYSVDESAAGLVGTFLFFSYAIGQIVNGLFCKKYNLKWIVFGAVLCSGIMNILVGFSKSFQFVKIFWLINGAALSILWPCVIRLLSETLAKKHMPIASVSMGTTVAVGTLLIYGLSSIFIKFNFKLSFFVPGVVLAVVAFVWLLLYSKALNDAVEAEKVFEEEIITNDSVEHQRTTKREERLLYLMLGVLPVFAIATNLIKDGLTSWMPKILIDEYNLDESISIILTLSLPLFAMFANFFAVSLHKKITNFVYQCTFIYGVTGLLIGGIILFLPQKVMMVTLFGCIVSCFLTSSCNSVITSIVPLYMKGKLDAGKLAGFLNAFCYLGSVISDYGLGTVKKYFSWSTVFGLLFAFCVLCCFVGLVYFLIKTKMERQKK